MKFVPAKHFQTASRTKGDIDWIVIHDMEMGERHDTAEACARMFSTTTRSASAHYCVDSDSAVQCVKDKDIAWAAPGSNTRGLHFEHAGFASQSRTDWLDTYDKGVLTISARLVAAKCKKYGIPVVKISAADLRAGKRGICGHMDVSNAWHKTTHTDPGPNFPWDVYIAMVKVERDALDGKTWTKKRVSALAVALGVAVTFFTGLTQASPAPAPKPTPSASSPASSPTSSIAPLPKPKPPLPKPKPPLPKPTKPYVAPKTVINGVLKIGSTGADVKAVQRLVGVKADGDFGPVTARAVKAWQKKKHLTPDGEFGPASTRAAGWTWKAS